MAFTTTLGTLVDRTRRFVRDYPDYDTLTAALTDTTGTTVTVADTSIYGKRWPIEVDYESMQIRALASATTLTVERGAFGSTAATHLNGTRVLVGPRFYAAEIIDAINQAILSTFSSLYKQVTDTSITTTDQTYEYAIPNMPGAYSGTTIQIPQVWKVELKYQADLTYRQVDRWQIVQGQSRLLKFRSPEPAGANVRISGWGPFPGLAAITDVLDPAFPPEAEYLLPMFASAFLLMSGEAGRVRVDTGATDAREQANRVGASLQAGLSLLTRAELKLRDVAMSPLPKHVKTNI